MTSSAIEIQGPRLFNGRAVLIVCAFGLLLVIPVLLAMLIVSSFQFGIWTILVPLAAIGLATLLLPFGFGNTYVARMVRTLRPADWPEADSFIVQITLAPRICSGFRAVVEDADDVGWLNLGASGLGFVGDSVRFSIPYSSIRDLSSRTIGLRGLFVYPCLTLSVSGLSGVQELRIAERSGWFLGKSRSNTRKLCDRLKQERESASAGAGP